MTKEKVNEIILQYKKDLPADGLINLRNKLEAAGDYVYDEIVMAETYSSTTTLLLSLFLGNFGVDRFYINDIGLGIAKLFLNWFTFGIWSFVDIFVSYRKARKKNLQTFLNLAS